MRINLKFWVWGVILGLIILVIFVGGRSFLKSRQPSLQTTTVTSGSIQQVVSASGKIKAGKEVELKFQTSGRLAWVGVKEGDRVNDWQAIAQLDQTELLKNLEKALRDYSKERNDFEEDRQVTYKDKIITDTIKRILEKNQWDLDKAVLDVELKDLALKYSTLITPISGVITRIDTPIAGVNIISASTVFTISDPESVVFSAQIDEVDIGNIREDQEATLTLDAYPNQNFRGKVTKVAFSAVATAGGGTAFPVEISLPENTNQRFRIGMNGDAEIITDRKDKTLIVPQEAIAEKDGKTYLLLSENDSPKEVEILTGLAGDETVEILEGAKAGDRVILPK